MLKKIIFPIAFLLFLSVLFSPQKVLADCFNFGINLVPSCPAGSPCDSGQVITIQPGSSAPDPLYNYTNLEILAEGPSYPLQPVLTDIRTNVDCELSFGGNDHFSIVAPVTGFYRLYLTEFGSTCGPSDNCWYFGGVWLNAPSAPPQCGEQCDFNNDTCADQVNCRCTWCSGPDNYYCGGCAYIPTATPPGGCDPGSYIYGCCRAREDPSGDCILDVNNCSGGGSPWVFRQPVTDLCICYCVPPTPTPPIFTCHVNGFFQCESTTTCPTPTVSVREELNPFQSCSGNSISTAIGCIPVGDRNAFLSFILRWALGISSGVSFILIIYSGFSIMTSGGDKRKLQSGKELLTAALSGLMLIIFSVFILDFIGIRILRIPGL